MTNSESQLSLHKSLYQVFSIGGNTGQGYTLKCLSIGTPNTTIFPSVPNGKRWLLGVPILEYIIIRL